MYELIEFWYIKNFSVLIEKAFFEGCLYWYFIQVHKIYLYRSQYSFLRFFQAFILLSLSLFLLSVWCLYLFILSSYWRLIIISFHAFLGSFFHSFFDFHPFVLSYLFLIIVSLFPSHFHFTSFSSSLIILDFAILSLCFVSFSCVFLNSFLTCSPPHSSHTLAFIYNLSLSLSTYPLAISFFSFILLFLICFPVTFLLLRCHLIKVNWLAVQNWTQLQK